MAVAMRRRRRKFQQLFRRLRLGHKNLGLGLRRHFRRVGIGGCSYTAVPTKISTVATPTVSAAQNTGVGLQRPFSADV